MRGALITGAGLVSAAGPDAPAHLAALDALLAGKARPAPDTETYAPACLYRADPAAVEPWVPKRADRRQMELWQMLGVAAAGEALAAAGLAGAARDVELHVAADGGGRDGAADLAIANTLAVAPAAEREDSLAARLQRELKPSAFLAQLPNMLGGNIAILHGVGGAARTFLGEESAAVSAVCAALARLGETTGGAVLAGGAYDPAPSDRMQVLAFADALHRETPRTVFASERHGVIPGAVGAFVVMEATGVRPLARLVSVGTGWEGEPNRPDAEALKSALAELGPAAPELVISCASGAPHRTAAEAAALADAYPAAQIAALGDLTGHGLEAAFPAGIALAATALSAGRATRVVVSLMGYRRGAGAAFLEAVE